MSDPLLFTLVRDVDESGISGTGTVADGVRWPDGTVALRWRSEHASTVLYPSMAPLRSIHGHGGKTRVVWADGLDPKKHPFLRGAFTCALDANENAPFGSVGGQGSMTAPAYISDEDGPEYLAGYADQAHAMWGDGWPEITFTWVPVMELLSGPTTIVEVPNE